jgi:4'-phosphopantetheinyl transferase
MPPTAAVPSSLGPNDVHVWLSVPERISDPSLLARYQTLLSDEERARAARFAFAEHRHQFCVAHALVRASLSRYAPVAPEAWRFAAAERGRPEIVAAAPDLPPLRFNLSHAAGLVGCAVALRRDVGVDIEDFTRRVEIEAIARRYFAPVEQLALERAGAKRRRERFFELWTLKEAYVKARGLGLAPALEKIAFELEPGAPIRLRFGPGFDDDPDAWQLALHRPTERHVLAVAVRRAADPDLAIALHECVPLLA